VAALRLIGAGVDQPPDQEVEKRHANQTSKAMKPRMAAMTKIRSIGSLSRAPAERLVAHASVPGLAPDGSPAPASSG
jgi:hypothetical protein